MLDPKILSTFNNRNILVTGGTGMIGRQVVRVLAEAGANIRVVSLDRIAPHSGVDLVFGDLTDLSLCLEVTHGIDDVFHLAGIKGSAQVSNTRLATHFVPALMINTNVLEACRRNRVQRLVFTSSIGAYRAAEVFSEDMPGTYSDAPMDFAGWAKRMGELQIHAYRAEFGIDSYSIVRPSNVYGPGDNFDPDNAMVIPSLMYRIHGRENPVVIWGDGSAIRDFCYSGDVADGIILALYHGTQGRYVNLGSGRGCSILELVETLRSFINFDYRFDTTKTTGSPKRVMDISLARAMIGYNPSTPLITGLQTTWNWYMDHQDDFLKRKNYFAEAKEE